MPRLWTLPALLLLWLLAPAILYAQQVSDRLCTDDRGTDRCGADQRRGVLTLFGARPIEEHARAGDQVRRVFFVDGYGRDLIAIEFVRTAGRDPLLRVRYPRPGEGRALPVLETAVPTRVWDDLILRSRQFDRRFAPRETQHEREISIGLHCWIYTVEAVDPAVGYAPAHVRDKVESACEDGPAQLLAHDMARDALRLLPHCAELDPAHHRNEAAILSACALLSGDRMAAAEVMNRMRPLLQVRGPQDEGRLRGVFDYQLRVDWNGESNSGSGTAAAFWTGKLAQPSGWANFYIRSLEGESANRVRVLGSLSRSVDTPRGSATGIENAAVELIWTRLPNSLPFQISTARVGPWQADPPR